MFRCYNQESPVTSKESYRRATFRSIQISSVQISEVIYSTSAWWITSK
ncbi:hypothetical protein T12_10196 [Trichinella patagoniensis]|uniref:Uncharacterized protein n=1 Tax=Trichinella patagoniensis TaxID=990121 RepID=A0A0V0YQT0_9BILA|nr:hypothetical protein T12_10196 [Trichinella patagoniensis]